MYFCSIDFTKAVGGDIGINPRGLGESRLPQILGRGRSGSLRGCEILL